MRYTHKLKCGFCNKILNWFRGQPVGVRAAIVSGIFILASAIIQSSDIFNSQEMTDSSVKIIDISINDTNRPVMLDFKLRNTGTQIAYITRAEFHVNKVWFFQYPFLPSMVPTSWTYDIELPPINKSYIKIMSISQAIRPNDVDRFSFRVGTNDPSDIGNAGEYIYNLRIDLKYNENNETISSGNLLFVIPNPVIIHGGSYVGGNFSKECNEHNQKIILDIQNSEGKKSERLINDLKNFQNYSTDLEAIQGIVVLGDPSISPGTAMFPEYLKSFNATDWIKLGYNSLNINRYDMSLYCFEKATMIDPDLEDAWTGKGYALTIMGKYDESIKCFDKAISINPQDKKPWSGKALATVSLGEYVEALNAIDNVIALDQHDALAWTQKGVILSIQRKYNESIQALDKAIELDPSNAIAWETKSLALQELGRISEAEIASAKSNELAQADSAVIHS